MNESEKRIFLASCDQVLTLTLAQLRVVVAHVTPVAQNLEAGSVDRGYLDSSLGHLHDLHGYLLDQLNKLNALSMATAGNQVGAQAPTASTARTDAGASPEAADSGASCASNDAKPEISIH